MQNETSTAITVHSGSNGNTALDIFNPDKVNSALRIATEIASSNIIPYAYQGKPANCFIALYRAARLNVDPIAMMESSYIVNGKVGFEGKFVIAMINSSGKFKGPLRFEFSGELDLDQNNHPTNKSTLKCRAFAVSKEDGQECSQEISLKDAFVNGWMQKKDSKWPKMPKEMLQYRAASFFGKMYCPEKIMGIHMVEELQDIQDAEYTDEEAKYAKQLFEKGVGAEYKKEQAIPEAVVVEPEPVQEQKDDPAGIDFAAVQEAEAEALAEEERPTDLKEFRVWFEKKFEGELTTIDSFFVKTKWLRPGESIPSLKEVRVRYIMDNYDSFIGAYNSFKGAA